MLNYSQLSAGGRLLQGVLSAGHLMEALEWAQSPGKGVQVGVGVWDLRGLLQTFLFHQQSCSGFSTAVPLSELIEASPDCHHHILVSFSAPWIHSLVSSGAL